MPTWSDWSGLDSAGHISAPLPSIFVQYRYAITEKVYLTDAGSMSKIVPGEWELRILDESDAERFHQHVVVRFDVFYGIDSFFGLSLLTFFVWTYNTDAEVITTTVPDPVETMGDMAEQGYMQPGGGSTYTAQYGYIAESTANGDSGDGYWYSPIYELALPPGSRFEVLKHTIGVPLLAGTQVPFLANRLMAIQVRTAMGGAFGSLTDEAGFLRIADPTGGNLMQRYWRRPDAMVTRPMPTSASEPSIWKDAQNTMWLACRKALAFRLYRSRDDGYTWEDVEIMLWPDGYTNPFATGGMAGRVYTIATKSGDLWFRSSADQFTGQTRIAQVSDPHQIQQGRSADELLVFPTAGGDVYRSTDGGKTWVAVETSAV